MTQKNRTFRIAGGIALLALASGCGGNKPATSHPEGTAAPKGKSPADIEAMMRRERADVPVHEIASADGSLRLSVPSTSPGKVQSLDGYFAIEAPFEDGKLQCFVYPERKDAASLMRLFVDGTVGEVAEQHAFQSVSAGVVKGRPYLVSNALYHVDGEEGRLVGDAKYGVGVLDGASIACVLDLPGFRETFKNAFRMILETLDSNTIRAVPEATYEEIVLTSAGDALARFAHAILRTEKDGTRTWITYSASISRNSEGGLNTGDNAEAETSKNGAIVSMNAIEVEDGEVKARIELTAGKKGEYRAAGEYQGKPIDARFTVKGGLPDNSRAMQDIARFLAQSKTASMEYPAYDIGADPTQPITLKVKRLSEPADYNVEISAGEISVLARVDARGSMERAELEAGSATVRMERVWQRGTP